MVASILIFALGSALTGAAQNVPMIIAGRTIQGAGGGGIQTLVRSFFLWEVESVVPMWCGIATAF
jgi:MFS family permease